MGCFGLRMNYIWLTTKIYLNSSNDDPKNEKQPKKKVPTKNDKIAKSNTEASKRHIKHIGCAKLDMKVFLFK
jgi:hypothetical protein